MISRQSCIPGKTCAGASQTYCAYIAVTLKSDRMNSSMMPIRILRESDEPIIGIAL